MARPLSMMPTCSLTANRPLTKPTATPASKPTAMAAALLQPLCKSAATRLPMKPGTPMMDRSRPPRMSTKVTPKAMTPTTDICPSISVMFDKERKFGAMMLKTAMMRNSAVSEP